MAEEVKKPSRDMPIGIVSCIVFVTLTYILMALSLVMMVPYNKVGTRYSRMLTSAASASA